MRFDCAGPPEHLSLHSAETFKRASWRVSGDVDEPRLVAVATRTVEQTCGIFVTDAANACIKWLDQQHDELKKVYRAERGARLLNMMLYDSNSPDLYAIESIEKSRLFTKTTRFRLLQIDCHYSLIKQEMICTIKWAAKLYRANTIKLDATGESTSLCHAGSYLLCSVAHSRRLVFFKHQSDKEEEEEMRLKRETRMKKDKSTRAAGNQLFDEEIMHIDALNSHSGSPVAIAFVHSIRLYRHESSQSKVAALNLQETFRVTRESVHKLLFYGDRLLVAERSQNKYNIWSWNIVGDRLETASRVHLDSQSSVQSWCIGPSENLIYCLDSVTNDILFLKLE